MRVGRLVACLGACVAAALGASVVSGASNAPLQRVTFFGDSQLTAVDATPEARAMLAKGIDLDLRAAVCRRLVQDSCPYEGARPRTVLDETRDTGVALGGTVVLLVGYNDYESEWARNIATLLRAFAARDVTRVLWLTLTERRQDWVEMNEILRTVAKSWPQLEVLDWSGAADPSWFREGDIHLTYEGATGLASYLHAALVVRGIAATTPAEPVRVPVRITIRGTGAVTVKGVRCRNTCSQLVALGSVVQLRANAPAGSVFARWSGACSGTRPACSLKVSGAASVVARFHAKAHSTM